MMLGRASAALMPNQPSSNAKALSLEIIHSFRPVSSSGGGSTPDAEVPPPPPGSNASMSTPIAILIAVSMEAIVIPCSLNSIQIFSANEVLLFNTLAIVSLKLVTWFFNLPFKRSIDSCLVTSSPEHRFSWLFLLSLHHRKLRDILEIPRAFDALS